MDSRTRGLRAGAASWARCSEAARPACAARLLFLECDDEVLRRRFTETRRRHPLADLPGVGDALAAERVLMAPLKAAADLVIDTSELSLPDLRRLLAGQFGAARPGSCRSPWSRSPIGMACRARPIWSSTCASCAIPTMSTRCGRETGQHPAVQEHIRADPAFGPFVAGLQALLLPLLPRFQTEGKSYLTIAFGCTGGKHRSVFLAELVSDWLRGCGLGRDHDPP